MSGVNDVSWQNLGVGSRPTTNTNELDQESFLKLMVAQLNNQDPTKPLDSNQFYSQMAQFSAVAGIQDLQTSFSQMASALSSNQALQASSLVGRDVLVSSSAGVLPSGGAMTGKINLPASTTELIVGVYDESGQLVRKLSLGNHAAGEVNFSWDGLTDTGEPATAGVYQIKAEAVIDGNNYAVETLTTARVNSVTLGGSGGAIVLNLGELGDVDLGAVRQIM